MRGSSKRQKESDCRQQPRTSALHRRCRCIDCFNPVTNASNPRQHTQIKFCLICRSLGGEIEHSAASDFSSILWVKCCLGNSQQKQAAGGGVGWGRLLRGSWTMVFCQRRVLNEKTVQEEKREAAEATDSWLRWFVLPVYAARPPELPASTINETHSSKTERSTMYKVMGRESQKAALLRSCSPLSALCVVRRLCFQVPCFFLSD